MENNEIIDQLLEEYKQQRQALIIMISDLEKVKQKIDILFPEQLDNRNVMRFQEKVKAVSEMFKSMLDIRKEISSSLKNEIEFRRKITIEDNKSDDENVDIRDLAKKVEKLGGKVIAFTEQKNREEEKISESIGG